MIYSPYNYGPNATVVFSKPTPDDAIYDKTYTPPIEASIFLRGIKRDPRNFNQLKDGKQWDKWNIHTTSQARSQQVNEILDPDYTLLGQEVTDIFILKQEYMFAVFPDILLTDKGKALVRDHHHIDNAQLVYKHLLAHATASTKASVESVDLLPYITSAEDDDGTWRGCTENFILHWLEQVRQYDEITRPQPAFNDEIKRVMLENAVTPIELFVLLRHMLNSSPNKMERH